MGVEGGPRSGWVDGVEKIVECFLFKWVNGRRFVVFRCQDNEEDEGEP